VIPFFLTGFLEKNAGIDLVLDVTNKSRVVESLKNNEIDFALVSVIPEKIQVEEELLIDNKLYLIGNQALRDEKKPLIYREEGSATRLAMEKYFETHQGNQRKRMELTSNEAVKQAVIAGLGYSIMPLIGIQNELLDEQLFIHPKEDLPMKTEWRLIWLKGKKMSPVSLAFLDYIRSEKEEILRKHFSWYLEF
ncbi:MAG: LysR substrate-binding domain-containing protein, partial [Algoriphagus sp.]